MADFLIGQRWEKCVSRLADKGMARLSLRIDRGLSRDARRNILDRLATGGAKSRRSGGASGHPADLWRCV